jgi:hypothetical protein
MAWAAQNVKGETATTVADRALRLREAEELDDELEARRYKHFLAYRAEMSRRVSRARWRFRDRFDHGDRNNRHRHRCEEEYKDLNRFVDEAEALVDDWHRHLEDWRSDMCWERLDRRAEVERLDLLDMEEDQIALLLDKAKQHRIDRIKKAEEDRWSSEEEECIERLKLDRTEDDSVRAMQSKLEEAPKAEASRLVQLEKEELDRIDQIKLDRMAKQESIRSQTHFLLMVLLHKSSMEILADEEESKPDTMAQQDFLSEEETAGWSSELKGSGFDAVLPLVLVRPALDTMEQPPLAMRRGWESSDALKSHLMDCLQARGTEEDANRARRFRQDASRWIYDPGGQLVV